MELKWSDVFQRKIRVGDWSEVGTPTWTLVREAIQAGKREEALELLDYVSNEVKVMHDTEHSLAEAASAYIADKMGEEELERFWRELMENSVIPSFLSAQTLEDVIRQTAECQRGHFGAVSVTEEPDRYIVTYRPCGSLVRLWQTRDVGKTRKPSTSRGSAGPNRRGRAGARGADRSFAPSISSSADSLNHPCLLIPW